MNCGKFYKSVCAILLRYQYSEVMDFSFLRYWVNQKAGLKGSQQGMRVFLKNFIYFFRVLLGG